MGGHSHSQFSIYISDPSLLKEASNAAAFAKALEADDDDDDLYQEEVLTHSLTHSLTNSLTYFTHPLT